jgi:hypothetical protein
LTAYTSTLPPAILTLLTSTHLLPHLQGTSLYPSLLDEKTSGRLREKYDAFVKPHESQFGYSYDLFLHSVQILTSRSFNKKTQGGITGPYMLPIIDLLNHASEGSCNCVLSADDAAFVMTTTRSVEAGEEMTHCYGKFSNAQLFQDYGFVEEGCSERCAVRFTVQDVLAACKSSSSGGQLEHVRERYKDSVFEEGLTDELVTLFMVLLVDYDVFDELFVKDEGGVFDREVVLSEEGLGGDVRNAIRAMCLVKLDSYSDFGNARKVGEEEGEGESYEVKCCRVIVDEEKKALGGYMEEIERLGRCEDEVEGTSGKGREVSQARPAVEPQKREDARATKKIKLF